MMNESHSAPGPPDGGVTNLVFFGQPSIGEKPSNGPGDSKVL